MNKVNGRNLGFDMISLIDNSKSGQIFSLCVTRKTYVFI